MYLASKPALVAAALPVAAAGAVVACTAYHVCEPGAISEGGASEWPVLLAPGTTDQVVCEVPFRAGSPRAVSGSGCGVMMFLVVVSDATPKGSAPI